MVGCMEWYVRTNCEMMLGFCCKALSPVNGGCRGYWKYKDRHKCQVFAISAVNLDTQLGCLLSRWVKKRALKVLKWFLDQFLSISSLAITYFIVFPFLISTLHLNNLGSIKMEKWPPLISPSLTKILIKSLVNSYNNVLSEMSLFMF